MFNTILVALSVLTLLAVGVFVGVFGKSIIEGIKVGLAARKVSREVDEDREIVMKKTLWRTTDGKAEIKWNNGALVHIGLISGVKYDSFEEFFDNEEMEMSTYDELKDAQRRFEQAVSHVEKDMYKPKYRREFDTERELGQKLYVYRLGNLRISDNVMVTIDDVDDERMVTKIMFALNGLETSTTIHALDFVVTKENTQEQVNVYMDMWAKYLDTHAEDAQAMAELEEHLNFYNETMADGQVAIVGNRVYVKAKLPKEGFFDNNVVSSPRDEVEAAIKGAQRYESVGQKK